MNCSYCGHFIARVVAPITIPTPPTTKGIIMREFIDSREGFDQYTPTPEDWAEYEQWLDKLEQKEQWEQLRRKESVVVPM